MAGEHASVDIDLYAGVDDIEQDLGQGVLPNDVIAGNLDLYDDVLAAPGDVPPEAEQVGPQNNRIYHPEEEAPTNNSGYSYRSYTTLHPKSAAAQAMQAKPVERPKGKPLYVGNLTWWTTDVDLNNALQECGITDLINMKFFDNRANGQSKGFALIELGSDTSVRLVLDKLPKLQIHGQNPVATPATKQHLQQFEAQSKKSGIAEREERPPPPMGRGYQPMRGMPGRGRGMVGGRFNQPGMPRMDFGGPPGDMGRTPWMGPGMPGHLPPRPPLPGMAYNVPPPDFNAPPIQGAPMGDNPMSVPPTSVVPPPGVPGMMPPDQRHPGEYLPPMPKGGVAPHVNPAFFPPDPAAQPEGYPAGAPPRADFIPGYGPRPGEDQYSESTRWNQALASSAIKRAMADANAGEFEAGIETLVTAISLIKQSPTANDEACQVLVQSLQDCLQGIESQLMMERRSSRKDSRYDEKEGGSEGSERRHRSHRSRRSRSRDRRSRSRSRSRSRERRSRSRDRYRSRR